MVVQKGRINRKRIHKNIEKLPGKNVQLHVDISHQLAMNISLQIQWGSENWTSKFQRHSKSVQIDVRFSNDPFLAAILF
jgi:hypothetical protein